VLIDKEKEVDKEEALTEEPLEVGTLQRREVQAFLKGEENPNP